MDVSSVTHSASADGRDCEVLNPLFFGKCAFDTAPGTYFIVERSSRELRWFGRSTVKCVRYRRRDWDVPMPDALCAYWTAWNEPDVDLIGEHVRRAVTEEVEWNDPRDSFVGVEELERAIRRLRASKPDYAFVIASEIDHQHRRLRYRWDMIRGDRTLMEGLDVVTLDPTCGLINRVDGFFGDPTPIDDGESGVPGSLRGHR